MSAALTVAIACSGSVKAETIVAYAPHTGAREVFDSNNPGRFATPTAVHERAGGLSRAGNLTWNINFNDVTIHNNIGFDDALQGAARRATVVAVLNYVNTVLNETSGATIDVKFDTSLTTGTSFLAFAFTFMAGGTGFSSGFAHDHITSGIDPSPSVVDIEATVNFGYNWNSDLSPPAANEVDLFTVLLHEVTHSLGFLNGSGADGTSAYSGTKSPGRYGVLAQFTRIDDAPPVGTGSATALWLAGGFFVGTAANLTSGRLVFTGPNSVAAFGANPPINSNPVFASGTSLSHWGDSLAGQAVMPGFVSPGVQVRQYAPFEIGALKDLGYSHIGSAPPPPPPPPPPLDSDGDGLPDSVETNTGVFVDATHTGTNPFNPDSDGDGVNDGIEVSLGTDPNNPLSFPSLPASGAWAVGLALGLVGALAALKSPARSR